MWIAVFCPIETVFIIAVILEWRDRGKTKKREELLFEPKKSAVDATIAAHTH